MPLSAAAEKALREAVASGKITKAQADRSRAIAARNDAIRAGKRAGMDGSPAQARTSSNKITTNNNSSGGSGKSSNSKSPIYVTDGQGNAYERKYDPDTKTYKDYWVGNAKDYNVIQGNPDENTGYKPANSSNSVNQNTTANQNAVSVNPNLNTTKEWFDKQYADIGGYKGYVDNQNKRYQWAIQNNDNDLIKRLKADAARVGYNLKMPEQQVIPTNMNNILNKYLEQTTPYQQQQTPTLSYNEALQQAENRLNPLYDQAIKELERKLAIDAERSGLDTSQLGNARLNQRLQDFLAQKNSAISGLAQELQNKSAEEARYAAEQAYRQHQGNIQNLLAGLGIMNTMNQQNIQNQQWQQQFGLNKDLALANLTGYYNGDPILKKVLADREYQLGLANTNFDNAIARANLALKQDMFEWEKKYKEDKDKSDADAKAKEIAAKLATDNNGYFDQDTYNKIYSSFTGKNALNDPFVKSIFEMFMRFGTGAGLPKNDYDKEALKEAGLIN
jgi:hypothetical protein